MRKRTYCVRLGTSGKEATLYINYSENCWDILKLSIQNFGDENLK
nr:MAG TPA: hypothetical protein [Caudoviricetes sp.]